jgi:hypothetical protein
MTLFPVPGGAVVGAIVGSSLGGGLGRAGLIDSGEVDTMHTSLVELESTKPRICTNATHDEA